MPTRYIVAFVAGKAVIGRQRFEEQNGPRRS